MSAFLEHHPRLLPALLFAATLAAQGGLLLLLRRHGLPRYGKAPALAVAPEAALLLLAAIVGASFTLGGIYFDLVALGGVVLAVVSLGISPVRYFGLRGPVSFPAALSLGLMVALAVFFPLQLLASQIEEVFRHFGLPTPPESAVSLFQNAHGLRLIQVLFVAALIAPLCEEAFFRGFLHPVLKARFPARPSVALCGTAALFAAIHGNWAVLLPLFGFGLVQGVAYELSGSLLLCVAVHFWFNALGIVALLAGLGPHAP